MKTINEYLETLKGEHIVLVFQQATRTNRIDDGSLLYLDAHKLTGKLEEVFADGWLLVDGSLHNLRFVMEIYKDP